MKKQVWEKVATLDIKYDETTLDLLLERIKSLVPEGTKDADIQISFETDYESSYYDEMIINAEMHISIRK